MIKKREYLEPLLEKSVALSSDNLGGYFSKLYLKNPSNWQNVVECTAGDQICTPTPYDVFSQFPANNWYTDKNYIQIHLKTKKISINSYKIHSERTVPNRAHLRNWAFKGSNDGTNWDVLHSENEYPGLNGKEITKEFKANSSKAYSYFQLIRTGNSWATGYPNRMALLSIDVFQNICLCTTSRKRILSNHIFFISLIYS